MSIEDELRQIIEETEHARMYVLCRLALLAWFFAAGVGLPAVALGIAALIPGHSPGVGWWSLGTGSVAFVLTAAGIYSYRSAGRPIYRQEWSV